MSKKEKKLLFSVTIQDCKVDTFRSGGPGGQHQNKVESGVRITHPPSGAIGESREDRSQHRNKAIAFRRMAETKKFQLWAKIEASRRRGEKSIDELVEDQLQPSNLKIEGKDSQGRWMEMEIKD